MFNLLTQQNSTSTVSGYEMAWQGIVLIIGSFVIPVIVTWYGCYTFPSVKRRIEARKHKRMESRLFYLIWCLRHREQFKMNLTAMAAASGLNLIGAAVFLVNSLYLSPGLRFLSTVVASCFLGRSFGIMLLVRRESVRAAWPKDELEILEAHLKEKNREISGFYTDHDGYTLGIAWLHSLVKDEPASEEVRNAVDSYLGVEREADSAEASGD